MNDLPHATLVTLLDYNPATGVFTWLAPLSNRVRVGDVAGYTQHGYVTIKVAGRSYKAHVLAWFYMHGVWPTGDIDHINTDKADNRIANLREATRAENMQNRRCSRGDNKTGLLGVHKAKSTGKWAAQIQVDGKKIMLGQTFDTPEEAHAAYVAAKQAHHPFSTLEGGL